MVINSNGIARKKTGAIVNKTMEPSHTVIPDGHTLESHTEGDKYFAYEWRKPTTKITINHNLEKNPSVTVIDTAGSEILGDIEYVDQNTLTLIFSAAVRGTAYLN